MRDHLEALDGAIQIEQLLAYTPELNPPRSAAFGDMRAHRHVAAAPGACFDGRRPRHRWGRHTHEGRPNMTLTESLRTVLKQKYADFSGRASRSEYWWFYLCLFIYGLVVGIVAGAFGIGGDDGPDVALLVAVLPFVIPVYAAGREPLRRTAGRDERAGTGRGLTRPPLRGRAAPAQGHTANAGGLKFLSAALGRTVRLGLGAARPARSRTGAGGRRSGRLFCPPR